MALGSDHETCEKVLHHRQTSLSQWRDRLRLLQWKIYKCKTCGKAYRSDYLLTSHRSWSHPHLKAEAVHFEDMQIQR
jgi:hypothetical protein